MINKLFYYIWELEKKYLSGRVRRSKFYLITKTIILLPFVILRLIGRVVWGVSPKKEDTYKPDSGWNLPLDKKLSNIVDGFANLAFPDKEVEALAHARAEICADCPLAVKTGMYSVVVDKRTKNIQGMKCDACGCNLSAKVRSVEEHCPKGKW